MPGPNDAIKYTPISVEQAVEAVKHDAWLYRAEIPDLRELLEALGREAPDKELHCRSCKILKCDCSDVEVSNPLDFTNATFSEKASFAVATFSERASFYNATFSKWASFHDAKFSREGSFDGATFSTSAEFGRATFSETADFTVAMFSGEASFGLGTFSGDVYFGGAVFSEGADFDMVTFSGVANFHGATFSEKASFVGATFSGDTYFAPESLQGSTFQGADLGGAQLQQIDLSDCNLRGVKNLVLDDTKIRNASFSPRARDRWSILRRTYTGPKMVFNLLFLVAFLVPFVVKTLFWVGVHDVQTGLEDRVEAVQKRIPTTVTSRIAEGIKDRTQWRTVKVWRLLIGAQDRWRYAAVPILLIVYNVLRALLTYAVGPLREEEERSGYSPRLRHESWGEWWRSPFSAYGWLIWPHWVMVRLFVIAVVIATWQFVAWMWLDVKLPPAENLL